MFQQQGGNNPYGSLGTLKCTECRNRRKKVSPIYLYVQIPDDSANTMKRDQICRAFSAPIMDRQVHVSRFPVLPVPDTHLLQVRVRTEGLKSVPWRYIMRE